MRSYLNNIFDYIFYRITKAYMKWDGKEGSTSWVAITMIQTFLSLSLFLMTLSLFFTTTSIKVYKEELGVLFISLLVFLSVMNYRKYRGKYDELNLKWEGESKHRKVINGFLIVILLLFSVIMIILPSFMINS